MLFLLLGRAGASSWEIVAERALWSAPFAGLLVVAARQQGEVRQALTNPRILAPLALSAALIAGGWSVYVWAVNHGRNIEGSLGYYINPLLNMAAGALLFRERIDRLGMIAIALAVTGVGLQTAALGHPPVIALFLAFSFWGYGMIRRRLPIEAQARLFVECLLMAPFGLAYVLWLGHAGGGVFGHRLGATLLTPLSGPATVVPLALFAWTARRLPFSTIGFLQFISPTMGFLLGLATGERLSAIGVLSFLFIWAGVAVFVFGAYRAARRLQRQA